MIRFLIERRATWSVPVLRPAAAHCRMSGSGIVRKSPLRLMAQPLGGGSVLVPGHVPEQVVAPALGRAADAEGEGEVRQGWRPPWPTDQAQPGLLGQQVSLL